MNKPDDWKFLNYNGMIKIFENTNENSKFKFQGLYNHGISELVFYGNSVEDIKEQVRNYLEDISKYRSWF